MTLVELQVLPVFVAMKVGNYQRLNLNIIRVWQKRRSRKSAMKHLKIAEGRAPDPQNQNVIAANLVKLEAGTDIN